jgi:hypothetical protein
MLGRVIPAPADAGLKPNDKGKFKTLIIMN